MHIQAATFALIPARLYTQHLLRLKNQTIRSSADWDKPQPLPTECLRELAWWKTNISHWNGKSILPQTPQRTIFVDASNTGWRCHLHIHPNKRLTAFGHWSHHETQTSINWRELKAAFLALKTFPYLKNMRIFIRTDNTTFRAYMNKHGGTRSLPLVDLATQLWKWCLQRGITIQSNHISGITILSPTSNHAVLIRRTIGWSLQQHFQLSNSTWAQTTSTSLPTALLPNYQSTCLGFPIRGAYSPTHSPFLGTSFNAHISTHHGT